MMFASRTDAGQKLGQLLRDEGVEADLVLGLPRGGVVVAAEVARVFGRPLDVLVVRKIGHPRSREFAVGALAEPDVVILDEVSLAGNPVNRALLHDIIAEETRTLRDYRVRFHRQELPNLTNKSILLVDDGLATGATMEAAVIAARKQAARTLTVAVPIASVSAMKRLALVADRVKALRVDEDFQAVGQYYLEFSQTSDEEVLALLEALAHP
jgi:putative phosphoribosyl transferase